MALYDQILAVYPALTPADFAPNGTIHLQNNSDGKGDYIKEWNHPTLARPTEAELA